MTAPASKTDTRETAPSGAPVPITNSHGPRAAVERVLAGHSVILRTDGRRIELPPKDQLAFLAGVGLMAAFDIIEWPVALAIAVGHQLAHSRHGEVLREFGEALEEA